ncbi:glycerol dehydrogenase [Levilactobacillus suantsaii]|uniref:Glycerol dehydrogenase n=1 Tax=Levilactobacillus suantsaii TaxID=2292255 RepID=A0A4Q0VGE7_9LACO|nr:glycerol dehydrogenase [Levilactobacillus suantsaii]QMU07312.1 glycerol dehydrogenase [Levilactobacillus suantsaii]RXI77033.1 glycerol dehydrogenase [Levilactobacillus suantsaii]
MTSIFGSPATYVQGINALQESDQYIKRLGQKAVLLADPVVLKIVGNDYETYLTTHGISVKKVQFNGEASDNEIKRVAGIGKDFGADLVIGMGGGKTLDSAKAIADDLQVAVAILPTLASTDAPCSRLSVIYSDDGSFEKYRFYDKSPDLVLIDTAIVAGAPARLLASGIADALATNVEAKAVARGNNQTMLGAQQTLVGNAIATKCEETLFKYGAEALASVKGHAVTKALDRVVEANTLMSGLGFESGGLAAAHAIHDGLTALHGPVHEMTHGEKVAFGTLTQLYLEGADQERFEKYLRFDLKLGLPTTFKDLHLENVSDDDLLKVGQQATAPEDTMKQMPFEVTPYDVVQAMKGVDAYSREVQGLA